MNDKSFKDYIENRTVADIMEDYGEPVDEWQTLLIMKHGKVKSFRHSNGKTFYCEQIDNYNIDESIAEILKGKTIEKQMEYYFVTESVRLYETSYGCISYNLLLKDDILVGATVKGYFKEGNLLLDRCVCTYYASDNEGSGTKDREDYAYLIFYNE